MAYYRTCPNCGSNNDPGEVCNCKDEKEDALRTQSRPQGKHRYGQYNDARADCQARIREGAEKCTA